MVRSDKGSAAEANSGDGEEIDRIMKEIEDLEKKMDAPAEAEAAAPAPAAEPEAEAPQAKVVQMRPVSAADTIAETDAVPAPDEPLFKETAGHSTGDGGLSMKIGGCTEVSLEFTRAGMSVSLSCTDEALTITTDQGAEFRIPFKRGA